MLWKVGRGDRGGSRRGQRERETEGDREAGVEELA